MNYYAYFTEIEDRFSARRGSILLLSTLDWALIETWREAGIPLEAVVRGIDNAFDKHDAKAARGKGATRKVNGLAWVSQAVMEAAEEMVEAATGIAPAKPEPQESGFEHDRVARFLDMNAQALTASRAARLTDTVSSTAARLTELALTMRSATPLALDDLDRTLTVLEERLIASVKNAVPESEIVSLREQADRELAPYRGKMSPAQLKQVVSQFEQKRLFEAYVLPRLSLFYMGHE